MLFRLAFLGTVRLAAAIALVAPAPAVERVDPAVPLSQRPEAMRAIDRTVDAAFATAAGASSVVLLPADRIAPGYATGFAAAVRRVPAQLAGEGPYQAQQARGFLPGVHVDPVVVDRVLDRLDRLGGRVLDELARPDVVLHAFASYDGGEAPGADAGAETSIMGFGEAR